MNNKHGVHPIILNNKQHRTHWFNKKGNYVDIFQGIDGKTYIAEVEPSKWPSEIWELYEKEGISVSGPTPVEDIHYPEKDIE